MSVARTTEDVLPDAMAIFLAQLRADDTASVPSLSNEQHELAKVKFNLEKQYERCRLLTKRLVIYKNDIATLERHTAQKNQVIEDRNVIIQNLQDELMTLQLEFTKKDEAWNDLSREKQKAERRLMSFVAKKDDIMIKQEERIATLEATNRRLELDKEQLVNRWVAFAEQKASGQ